jgi:hypothetical protein
VELTCAAIIGNQHIPLGLSLYPDHTKAKGAMIFRWDAVILDVQLAAIQQGVCQMAWPREEQIAFKLVKEAD